MADRPTVVYEIHLRTFTDRGTLTAAIEHLDHLERLGITDIELAPPLPDHRPQEMEAFRAACALHHLVIASTPTSAESEFPRALHEHLTTQPSASDALARVLMGARAHTTSTQVRDQSHRLVHLAGTERARIAAALLFTSRFTPLLVQGEEWGASARPGAVLDWKEITQAAHSPLVGWYRALLALRRDHPELRDPAPSSLHAEQRGPLLIVDRGPITVLVNASDRSVEANLAHVIASSRPQHRADHLGPRSCSLVRAH